MASNDALNQIAGSYGSYPLATGAQTVYLPTYAFEAEEDTTFGAFYDDQDEEIVFHPWKGKAVKEGKTAFLGQKVQKFTITAGGKGSAFPSTEDLPVPALLDVSTDATGAKILLTFDRPMSDPAGLHASFIVLTDDEENEVTAAALNTNTKIELTLTTSVIFGQVSTVSMATRAVASEYGAPAYVIANELVSNIVLQVPAVQSIATNAAGTKIILTYNIIMANPAANKGDFSLKYGGAAKVINTAALGANTKTIELTPAVAAINTDVVTLSLTAGNIASALGGKAAAFTDTAVTNNVPA